ncbi:hypothetical protein ASG40_19795 [Methylobacterium sp. Leaf399]|nr:hypothetical protein ASG40_19795 [Methylobacterium sp. Leaf399]
MSHPGWQAVSVLVIAPFVERSFFERLLNDLAPVRLLVLVDDGCRPDDITMLARLSKSGTEVQTALGGVRGLMHAKIMHIAWRTTAGNRAHTLVCGSGNATGAAFAGGINAELFCKVRLTAAKHHDTIRWAERVSAAVVAACTGAATRIDEHPDVELARGVSMRLPSMRIKPADARIGSFDLWLQRGFIVAEYRPNPEFLRISVDLRERLPPGNLERRVLALGFETTPTKRLTLPYVETENGGSGGGERWKGRYFVWTQLGAWCSASCRKERGRVFVKAGRKGRVRTLGRLALLKDQTQLEHAKARHLDRLEGLWSTLGEDAGRYLASSRGGLDRKHYGDRFEERVRHDLTLADDDVFQERYISGCEIIDVPRFRADEAAWGAFVASFAEQLHIEDMRRRSMSALYRHVRSGLSGIVDGPFEDPIKLVKALRRNWTKQVNGDEGTRMPLGELVDGYHRPRKPRA